ncbi:DUF1918 domain-containing protein [Kitasatospora sp. NPDC127111]|uniref:DUF1918 domain-containing protein n=1 Tax=Kitasatospora sp. NPDC127111 TaxID=3345363 RepID=UPI00362DD248
MKASIGDRLIVEGTRPGTPRRDGRIVAVHHADGSPPYDVLWSDNGRISLCFPGPDAHLHHFTHAEREEAPAVTGSNALHTLHTFPD